ncbi:MAG: TonB-dependent hemoglobin/transferrin/lactoferrin family receptor [Burkholderiales bacterium]|nr:TonB-dependent hemoglobin/transferrin/lactoferrin family receptor [Burkholderiales bacterium]
MQGIRFQLRPVVLLVAVACNSALADDAPALKEMVVTATRSASDLDSLASTTTSIKRTQMDRSLPTDETDLFKDESDIAFARDLRRHGATRVNIRGIEDNRVVSMVDGVRLGDYYNGGGPTNFTQSASPTAMPDFLKRIEIVRGAASSLYGSDAIGGVVGYVTLDPADLLVGDATTGFRLRGGYTAANGGLSQTVLGAFRGGTAEVLLGYSHASGRQVDNQGSVDTISTSRTRPNLLKSEDQGVLAKFSVRPAAGHKLSATVEGRDQQVDSDILRLSSALPKVTAVRGEDNARRVRTSVEWEHTPRGAPLYDRLRARLYRQDSATRNYNFQTRSNTSATCSAASGTGSNCYIESDFSVEQSSTGASLQLEKGLESGGVSQLLTYGADAGRARVEELRDARIWNRTTGSFSKSLAGENYPLRDFATGKTDTLGLFLQDEISGLLDGKLSLTPGVRYDRTNLAPEVDLLAQQVLTGMNRKAVEQTHGAFSPKLGAVWRLDPVVSAYGQVARGFRAPNYSEVNGVFRNTAQQYGITPNPDLKPETSVGVELGLRTSSGGLRTQVSVFDNRYQDFIESVRYDCPGNPNCITGTVSTYQSVNLNRVRIYGAELRMNWDFAPGWTTGTSLALAQGTNEESGQPLNSIEPARLSASLARSFDTWGIEGRLRAAAQKDRVDDTAGTWFRPGSYAVGDVSVWWKTSRKSHLTLAVNNLFDKKYWRWSDIRQADATNPVGVDFYSQPGRTVSLAFQLDI